MSLDQPTLIQFEAARKEAGMIPPEGSNSFYTIGDGEINLLVKRSNPQDYRFELFTNSGHIYTGPGNFVIAGDIKDPSTPYENLYIIHDTQLSVNHIMTISRGKMEVHGVLELMENSQLILKDGAQVTFYLESNFIVKNNVQIIIEPGCSMTIYGEITTHLSLVSTLMDHHSITIDSAAVMTIDGLEQLGERSFSLTDYDAYLRTQKISKNSQGEYNNPEGRLGYIWVDGSPSTGNQLIDLSVLYGSAILGDFKFSVLGYPKELSINKQVIRSLKIQKGCTLYISEEYKGYTYIRPDLYLGVIINNNQVPADCTIDGTIIVDGINSHITVDRGGTIHLQEGGEIWLKNGSTIRSTNNNPNTPIFYLDGTLYMDDISQIASFTHENIVMGRTGKVVIYNPDTGEKRLLWSTPYGIERTDLYRLFKDRIDQVEYHISNNTGISIDTYYVYYNRDFTSWYGGRRFEKALKDGILVWHSGGFIQLDRKIIPWVNQSSTLLDIAKLFKTFGTYDSERLQECVDKLRYAGSGNIVFRFIDQDHVHEVTLNLEDIHITNVYRHAASTLYTVNTTNDGQLYLRNKVQHAEPDEIISKKSKVLEVEGKEVTFML